MTNTYGSTVRRPEKWHSTIVQWPTHSVHQTQTDRSCSAQPSHLQCRCVCVCACARVCSSPARIMTSGAAVCTLAAAHPMAWTNERLKLSCADGIGFKSLWKMLVLDKSGGSSRSNNDVSAATCDYIKCMCSYVRQHIFLAKRSITSFCFGAKLNVHRLWDDGSFPHNFGVTNY